MSNALVTWSQNFIIKMSESSTLCTSLEQYWIYSISYTKYDDIGNHVILFIRIIMLTTLLLLLNLN